ncbi:hormone receptor 4-like isoform X1 [Tachypleus tridentatus]|uniref:hormone receptor 4-like isoform X1 n=1 Tax=Tachypleus tridentatus TaxID=6853 RepID=UPI003FD131A6
MFPLLLEWMRKMSLFHDIKLKRRKVDSRCSSDGEINPDPNNSSSDSAATLEPVLKEGELIHLTSDFSLGSDEGVETSSIAHSEGLDRRSPDTSLLENKEEESMKESSPESSHSSIQRTISSEMEETRESSTSGSQRTQGTNVFDYGGVGDREIESTEFQREGQREPVVERGLDLSTPLRQRGFMEELPHLNPHLWAPSSAQAYRHHFTANQEQPQEEQHGLSLLRVASQYKTPLLMGDIPGSGPGKTMIWTGQSPSQGLQECQYDHTGPTGTLSSETALSRRHSVSIIERTGFLGSPFASQSKPPSVYTSTPSSSTASSATSVGQFGTSTGSNNEFPLKGNYPSSTLQYGANVQRIQFTSASTPTSREDVLPQFRSRSSSLVSTSVASWQPQPPSLLSPTQLSDSQALNLSVSYNRKEESTTMVATPSTSRGPQGDEEEEDNPMVCMICEDKATGLHYGIITCEGCKGFFKRTVQNKRVYTCVADGSCEITKAQRNRCQYCRFQKCLRQGMVLAAVREDRMPGGRNSGAVYNLYKVKYKKNKKGQKNGQVRQEQQKSPNRYAQQEWAKGQILKTALTNPADVMHLRRHLENCVSSSRDRQMPIEEAVGMITQLIECDDFEDVATLSNLQDLLSIKYELSEKLCQIGDNIVFKLVQWTKRLPFYSELPVTVHTQLLTHKWHELLVLTTCAYQAIHGPVKSSETSLDQEIAAGLCRLQSCLAAMMGRSITLEQLRLEAGPLVDRLIQLGSAFRRMKLCVEEYVCLKVIIMLNQEGFQGQGELETIQERYLTTLRVFIEYRFHQQPNRFNDLLACLPEVNAAAGLLLQSKMFYVPFVLNTSINR